MAGRALPHHLPGGSNRFSQKPPGTGGQMGQGAPPVDKGIGCGTGTFSPGDQQRTGKSDGAAAPA